MAEDEKDVQKTFDDIVKSLERGMSSSEIAKRQRESIAYFSGRNKAKTVDTGRANLSMMTKGQRGVSDLIPGTMMTYAYSAKNADTLPYWDRFPLIVFLDVQKNGNLLALNMHYLPPDFRAKILAELMKTVTAKDLRHDVRMRITYQKCQRIAAFQPLQFALKSYIPQRVSTKIVRIQPDAWHHAIFFPSQMFVNASERKVWSDFRRFR